MSFEAHVLEVLIASPSDTKEARDEVEKALHTWNGSRSKREGIVLLPRRWETDAVPRLGEGDGQEVINSQLVDDADIVVVIFNSKLGQATARAISGTAEELDKAVQDGKQVHVYFSDAPVPRDSLKGASEVEKFRKSLESRGLYGSYSDAADLGFKVRNAVESDLDKLGLAAPQGRKGPTGADPVVSFKYETEPHVDKSGRTRNRKRGHRITVVNHGDATAEKFRFSLTPLDDDPLPIMPENDVAPTLTPRSEYSWSLMPYGSSSNSIQVDMMWSENGQEKTKTQSLSLL